MSLAKKRGVNYSTWRKKSLVRERTSNRLNPHKASYSAGTRTLTKLLEGGCSHPEPFLLPCPFEKPVIVVGIQMKGLISTELFQKIVISYEVLCFSRFWRNDRNSFYHLCGLTVSQKSQNYTRKVNCNTAFSITQWIPWVDFCNRRLSKTGKTSNMYIFCCKNYNYS